MPVILVATQSGCLTFYESDQSRIELPGRQISALTLDPDGSCLAVVDEQEIWRRSTPGAWSPLARTDTPLQSLISLPGCVFAGGLNEAILFCVSPTGRIERLKGFDAVPGRDEWFPGGPPLGGRSLAATADQASLLAAVHVGGIPRSRDNGHTWTPTIPHHVRRA